ncbi:TPA: hypothetical protein R5T48_000905 [Staphylococcus aureus]|nr:hypothetical protein [Staphylococcus aureus]
MLLTTPIRLYLIDNNYQLLVLIVAHPN